MKVIIEHMDKEVYEWSILEYKHISRIVGRKDLWFTNVPKKERQKLQSLGTCFEASVLSMDLQNCCVLDPKAKKILQPSDEYTYYVFGGVLGNHPMDGRTAKILGSLEAKKRNLGKVQMSTNTAVLVAHRIIVQKKAWTTLQFHDTLEIHLDKHFSNILPYRYLIENNKAIVPSGFRSFLKKQKDNQ